MVMGSLRLASVWFGFFDIWALRLAVFSNTTMNEVHGRTFGVWTLLTRTLCFLCAFNLDNKPLYLATFLSFIYAFGHFLTEYLIYHTMAIENLTTVGIFAGFFAASIFSPYESPFGYNQTLILHPSASKGPSLGAIAWKERRSRSPTKKHSPPDRREKQGGKTSRIQL